MYVCGDPCGPIQHLSLKKETTSSKEIFHGRGNIVPQFMFNMDVAYTLRLVHHNLAQIEGSETMAFLDESS